MQLKLKTKKVPLQPKHFGWEPWEQTQKVALEAPTKMQRHPPKCFSIEIKGMATQCIWLDTGLLEPVRSLGMPGLLEQWLCPWWSLPFRRASPEVLIQPFRPLVQLCYIIPTAQAWLYSCSSWVGPFFRKHPFVILYFKVSFEMSGTAPRIRTRCSQFTCAPGEVAAP